MAKLALFMYLSRQLSRKQDVIEDWRKGFLPLIVPVAIICILIAPANLSTALLTGAICMLIMFIGRVRVRHLALVVAVAAVPLAVLVAVALSTGEGGKALPDAFEKSRVGTWMSRIRDFANPDRQEAAYQVQQAKIAIAKGGWIGLGPGNSESRNFLPHPYSDFIYAIILEEYGLVGGALLLFLYLYFLFRCIRLFKRCPFAFGAFLALSLGFTLAVQAMVNMAVNVNLFPVTGVTLPLVSMGGSSFLFTCVAIGIILSVARNVEKLEGAEAAEASAATEPNHKA